MWLLFIDYLSHALCDKELV